MAAAITTLLLTLLLGVSSVFAQTSPPPSNGPNPGPGEALSGATSFVPGDPHGAVGPTHVVLKANEEFQFINRSTGAVTTTTDSAFWGTNWGFATRAFRGDGRVYFDPYGPGSTCATGGGRWLALELAQANYSNGTHQGGIVWAISQTSDPTGSWAFWWTADPNAQSSTLCTAGHLCRSDYPQLGFNTSLVAISVHQFYQNLDPEIFIFPKAPAECSGSISVWFNEEDATNDVTCPAQNLLHQRPGRGWFDALPRQ